MLLLRRLAETWRERPTDQVIIAAGSTGSAPAAADLLAAIAGAPRGCVVLPGLDKSLADKAWTVVDEQHPQGGLKRLLDRFALTRDHITDWDPAAERETAGRWRRRLINEALRPPAATADWLLQIDGLRAEGAAAGLDPIAEGLKGLSVVTARNEEEAATLAALLLRETLEVPDLTAALITPDAALARRVSARLTRWGVVADSSAGRPLAGAPVAVLASLVARATADPADPVTLLAIVKHPLTRLALNESDLVEARRTLERYGLRGPPTRRLGSPAGPGLAGHPSGLDLAHRLHAVLSIAVAPYADSAMPREPSPPRPRWLIRWRRWPPTVRATPGALWAGPAGEAASGLVSALIHEGEGLPDATPAGFAELLQGLLVGQPVRAGGGPGHPRIAILGVLEARLVRAGRLILAGLEEGTWPRGAGIDPFLSRPMRQQLGLPPPERRSGLSAHDFAQAAAAPNVVLINTERRAGTPAVASRWLWRLRTLVGGAGLALPSRDDILAAARSMDAPLDPAPRSLATAARPAPTPPVAVRPRRMAVTSVERWVRDPYGLYARYILNLRPLDPPDMPIEALARGTAIHAAFERFSRDHPGSNAAGRRGCVHRHDRRRPGRGRDAARPDGPRTGAGCQCRALGHGFRTPPPSGPRGYTWKSKARICRFRHARRDVHADGQGRPHRGARRSRRYPRFQDRPTAERQGSARRVRPTADLDRRHPGGRRFPRAGPGRTRRSGLCADIRRTHARQGGHLFRSGRKPGPGGGGSRGASSGASPFSTTPPRPTCPGPLPSSSPASTATTTTSPGCGNGM